MSAPGQDPSPAAPPEDPVRSATDPAPPLGTVPGTESAPPTAPTAMVEPMADARLGTVIAGRYRLVAVLGEGAMGAVYRGEHLALQKSVAVKILHPELVVVPEVVARFEREAVASARMDHPNVVAARDFGRDADGQFFLVLDYVEGRTLRDLLGTELPLSHDRALRIARHVAAGLTHAHALGLVHRDIKPENVIVSPRNGDADFALVIDFGVARIGSDGLRADTAPPEASPREGRRLTLVGAILGTPDYMAPEQAAGTAVDARADLYAFGVMVFEMLTGRVPFTAHDLTTLLTLHLVAPPPSASEFAPPGTLPPAVDAVFHRILAKDPGARHPTATDFIDDLSTALAPPAPAPAPGSPAPWRSAVARVRDPWRAASTLQRSILAAATIASAATLLVAVHTSVRMHPTGHDQTSLQAHTLARTEALRPRSLPVTPVPDFGARLAAFRARPEIAPLLGATSGHVLHLATATVESARSAVPTDPVPTYLVATLYARDRTTLTTATERYAEALSREPTLSRDDTLQTDVLRAAVEPRVPSTLAVTLVRGPLASAMLPRLRDLLAGGPRVRGRLRVAALMAEPPFVQHLDAADLDLVALARAETCEQMRPAVEALGRDGDARMLTALQRIPVGRGCGFLGLGTCNACLESVVPAAIRAIEARAITTAGAPPPR